MAEILLFHHAQGLTPGVHDFAETLRRAGHIVHTPDLYEGRTFDTLDAGVAHAQSVGFDEVIERGRRAAEGLGSELVYAGMSLGALPAMSLAQTRPGARGALLFHAFVPPSEFGGPWPAGLPMQIHGMDADPEFADSGDLDAARAFVAETAEAGGAEHIELFVYPGSQHLFTDDSLPSYDKGATDLLTERMLAFLSR